MNILIFGANGRLGRELVARLSHASDHVTGLTRMDCDLVDPLASGRWIHTQRPDVVINATAMNGMEAVDRDPHLGFIVNAAAPAVMARECAEIGALFVHFSTDYVFSGRTTGFGLPEQEPTHPMGRYGWSKAKGEEAALECGENVLIFRVQSIFGTDFAGPLDVVRQVTQKGRGSELDPVQVLHQWTAPTSCRLIADAVAHAIKTVPRADWPAVRGIYHLATTDPVWKIEHAHAVLEAFLPRAMGRFHIVEGKLAVPRPVYTYLISHKFQEVFGYELPGWEKDLAASLDWLRPHLPT